MDFGQSILQKYGWSEGQGLGKHNSGISKPLKANLKFDTTGLGHDGAAEFKDHWWESAYNSAAANLDVKTDGESVKMELKDGQSGKISTSGHARSARNDSTKSSMYGNFVRCATLTSEGREDRIEEENTDVFPEFTPLARPLTDEELFRACGGRTAHKGARHGLKLSGKLARLAEQDNLLLQKLGEDKEDASAEYSEWQRKVNKKKKRRPIAAPTPHGSPEATVSDDQEAELLHSLELSEAAAQEKRLTKESLMRMSTKSHGIQRRHKKRKRDASAAERLMSEFYEQQSAERRSKKRDKKRRREAEREIVESSNSADSSRSHKRLRGGEEDPLVDRGVFETSTGIQVELDEPTPEEHKREKRSATRKSASRRNIRQITDRFARSLTTKEPSDDEGIDP